MRGGSMLHLIASKRLHGIANWFHVRAELLGSVWELWRVIHHRMPVFRQVTVPFRLATTFSGI
jgi:hypothetical protein